MMTFSALGKYGRLGNQMFQVASTIGIARKYGRGFCFPKWVNYDQQVRFNISDDYQIAEHFEHQLPLWDGRQYPEHFMHWGYSDLFVPDNVDLTGHMQSEKYFRHCEDVIRHYFQFKKPTDKHDYTAVHVRMGDYGSDYHPICTQEYYRQAVEKVGGKIILFSDEPQKAMQYLDGIRIHSVDTNKTIDALHAMSMCNRHIIANSTFSWWGAWLAKSECIVAPKQWFGPAASHLETKDIYPESWIII
jgi:hypothetical protein